MKPVFDLTRHLAGKKQGRKFNIFFEVDADVFKTFTHQGMTVYYKSAALDLNGELEVIDGHYFIYNLDGHIDFLDKAQELVGSFNIKSGENTDHGMTVPLSAFLGANAIDYILKHGDFE